MLMVKAPPHTNLGKYIFKLKIAQTAIPVQQKPVPAVTPIVMEDEEDTNNSDELDPDLKLVLGVD